MFKPTEAMLKEAAKREFHVYNYNHRDYEASLRSLRRHVDDGFVTCTDAPGGYQPVYGLIYEPLDDVRAFEEENHAFVYHVINYFYGLAYVYLYVKDTPDTWESERYDLVNGRLVDVYIKGTRLNPVSHAPEDEPDEGIYARSGLRDGFYTAKIAVDPESGLPFVAGL